MQNDDLIAFLQPVCNRFDTAEWRDATGTIQDIFSDEKILVIRASLPAGLYQGRIEMRKGSFDPGTAMMEMIRVPDGAREFVGPMDLDHIQNVMAVPMPLVRVNGRFRGGLWFSVPGPGQIAAGTISADFGFEHEGGSLELTLELLPRDQERLSWRNIQSLILRRDDRRLIEWRPLSPKRPRFYTGGWEREALAEKFSADSRFAEARRLLDPPVTEWSLYHEQNRGIFDLACVAGWATQDMEILSKAKDALLILCRAHTWSGRWREDWAPPAVRRPDLPADAAIEPHQMDALLMGGENDRGMGYKLSVAGVGWEFLRDSLSDDERIVVLTRAGEYLQKMYDFTLLQRGYMGCPSPDEHSLGTWWGVGIACMAFYDELPIARKALPFFHALMVDSFRLFSPSGKQPWATFQPMWPTRYFAAAIEFGGSIPEVDASPFLNHLAEALLASFRSPNAQEIQRGLRTVEHRALMAFLCAFHPTPQAAPAYAAFVEEERRLSGDVLWGIFDLLYGPSEPTKPAVFPEEPFFSRDTGEIIVTSGPQQVNYQISGGNLSGMKESFRLKPHNRERPRSMGDFILGVEGYPVLVRIQSSYGIFSAQRNALSFEEGGQQGDGQYLYGDIPAESVSFIRRYCRNDRFVYVDINFTPALQPRLEMEYAQRTFLVDRMTGIAIVLDAWKSRQFLRARTHLHCSGRITERGNLCWRLTGGQANAIAGIKYGDLGLINDERGEIYAQILDVPESWRVCIEEPQWFPGYIYGLNGLPGQTLETAQYPKLQRWRLELKDRASEGRFLFALMPQEGQVTMHERSISLPDGGMFAPYGGEISNGRWFCQAEAAAWTPEGTMALGVTRWEIDEARLILRSPVDILYNENTRQGVIFSGSDDPVKECTGFHVGDPEYDGDSQNNFLFWKRKFHLS